MQIKGAVIRNALAGMYSKISIVFYRILQVPMFISALGVEDYGRWLVLYSLPGWLLLANLGFGSVASNEISIAVAANDNTKARNVFSTTIALIALIGIVGTLIVGSITTFVPWETLLKFPSERHTELALAALWLAIDVFLSFFVETFNARFRAARKNHVGVFISTCLSWFELLAVFIALQFTTRFDHIALAMLFATILILSIKSWLSKRAMPSLTFSFADVQPEHFKFLFRKGVAFQAFPLGNALLFQGNLFIIQAILGPAAVATFGTARTLVRTVSQVMELINQSIWPELSHMFGSNDMRRAAQLHRTGVGLSIAAACLGVIVLAAVGQQIYGLWLGKDLMLPQHLLLLFLLPIPFNALWLTSSVIHTASNKHEGLAVRYLIATVLSTVACVILSYTQGVEGAALSTLVADLVLIPYVLNRSLILTNDTWPEFLSGIYRSAVTAPTLGIKLVRSYIKIT